MNRQYDYIITGAGAAGLSLLMRMMNDPFFDSKKILLTDKIAKDQNDRTWCFWEKEPDIFEPVLTHQWPALQFQSDSTTIRTDIQPYSYKMIRSKDLYQFVLDKAKTCSNVDIITEEVMSITDEGTHIAVRTISDAYTAGKVFNSILLDPIKRKRKDHWLLQHFKGWMIETPNDCFDPHCATFMDFTIDQSNGTAFMYVLPVSKTKALVEYTLFTETVLEDDAYEKVLNEYVSQHLPINAYTVTEKEFGIIPMTNYDFPRAKRNIHNIGTAGGWTKPSTGFTFKFIQKNAQCIVECLKKNQPVTYPNGERFKFYDAVFLNVLAKKRAKGRDLFTAMFTKNEFVQILRFLDNETSVKEEIKILRSLPTGTFTKAAADQMIRTIEI